MSDSESHHDAKSTKSKIKSRTVVGYPPSKRTSLASHQSHVSQKSHTSEHTVGHGGHDADQQSHRGRDHVERNNHHEKEEHNDYNYDRDVSHSVSHVASKSASHSVSHSVSSAGGGGGGGSDWVTKLIGMEEVSGNWKETIRMLEGEFWGTLFLVFLGVCSCMNWTPYGAPANSLVSISLTFGLAVATVAQMLGHVSGCHLNPAVSFGLVAAGDCGLIKAVLYFVAQTFGSFMGSMIAMAVLHPGFIGSGAGATGITGSLSKLNGIAPWQGVLNECCITFPLILTVCAVCDKGNDFKGSAPLAIGLAIALGHLAGIPATGASMNGARSIGPLIAASLFKKKVNAEAQTAITKARHDLWVYLVGPTLGGILAGLLYRFRYSSKCSPGGKEKED